MCIMLILTLRSMYREAQRWWWWFMIRSFAKQKDCSGNWATRHPAPSLLPSVHQVYFKQTHAFCIFQCVSNTIFHSIYFPGFFFAFSMRTNATERVCSLLRINRIKYIVCMCVAWFNLISNEEQKKLFEITE